MLRWPAPLQAAQVRHWPQEHLVGHAASAVAHHLSQSRFATSAAPGLLPRGLAGAAPATKACIYVWVMVAKPGEFALLLLAMEFTSIFEAWMHRRRELRLCTGWPTSNGGGLQTTAEPERQCGVGGAELPRPLHVRYGQPPCDVWEAWPGRCGPAVSLPLRRESHAKAGRLWSVTHHLRRWARRVCWNYVRLRLGFSIRSPGRLARGGSSVLARGRRVR